MSVSPTFPVPRRLACEGCGVEFTCGLSADCWCAAEAVRMPLPEGSGDCLCADCLRKASAQPGAMS